MPNIRMNESKIIYCPKCNANLRCWGYMVNATINCNECKTEFLLTADNWNSSLDQIIHKCLNCNKEVTMNILDHSDNDIIIQCIVCNKKESIPLIMKKKN